MSNNNSQTNNSTSPSSPFLPNTKKVKALIKEMAEDPESFRLGQVLSGEKSPSSLESRFDDGRIAFYGDFSLIPGNPFEFDFFSCWKSSKPSPFSNNGNFAVYRVTPLLASVMAENWSLCEACLRSKTYGQFSVDDLIVDYFNATLDNLCRNASPWETVVLPPPISNTMLLKNLAGGIIRHPSIPEKIRVCLLDRLHSVLSSETEWFLWPGANANHRREKEIVSFKESIRTLRLLKERKPELLNLILTNETYATIVLDYYTLFIHDGGVKNNPFIASTPDFMPEPSGELFEELYRMKHYNAPIHTSWLRICDETPDANGFISTFAAQLTNELECSRFHRLWLKATHQPLILDLTDPDVAAWFQSLYFPDDGSLYYTLLRLADRVILSEERRIKTRQRHLIDCNTPDLLILALEKNFIRKSDAKRLIRYAKKKEWNRLVPLLLLKLHGEWPETESA